MAKKAAPAKKKVKAAKTPPKVTARKSVKAAKSTPKVAAKKTVKATKVSPKAPAKKKVSKGDSLVCEVCGLSVVVEEAGGIAVGQVRPILCCGKAMKQKAKKKATAAKK